MGRPLKLLPLFTILLLMGSVVAALAITWTDPTYAFYGSAGTGPIYFEESFEATAGYWTGGCIVFSDFNMASAGVFGTIGFAADLGVSVNVVSVIPADSITLEVTSGAGGNFTVYTPTAIVYNATNVSAWDYDSGFMEATIPAGVAITVILSLQEGSTPYFIIPSWFIDQGGVVFGVAGFFSQLQLVMGEFVSWFLLSVSYIVSLIASIMLGIVSIAVFVITWFGRGINFMITLFTAVGNVFDTANTTVAPYAEVINLLFSADGLMLVFVIAFASWFGSLPARARRSGGNIASILTGDIQVAMYWVDLVWGWSWTVFNFVYGVIMQFVSLLWGLLP